MQEIELLYLSFRKEIEKKTLLRILTVLRSVIKKKKKK